MIDNGERLPCTACGQDWQTCYRARPDGRLFFLCPECESVWLPGDDRRGSPAQVLPDLFPPRQKHEAWYLIEPCNTSHGPDR
jgi:hypothetical protein